MNKKNKAATKRKAITVFKNLLKYIDNLEEVAYADISGDFLLEALENEDIAQEPQYEKIITKIRLTIDDEDYTIELIKLRNTFFDCIEEAWFELRSSDKVLFTDADYYAAEEAKITISVNDKDKSNNGDNDKDWGKNVNDFINNKPIA